MMDSCQCNLFYYFFDIELVVWGRMKYLLLLLVVLLCEVLSAELNTISCCEDPDNCECISCIWEVEAKENICENKELIREGDRPDCCNNIIDFSLY